MIKSASERGRFCFGDPERIVKFSVCIIAMPRISFKMKTISKQKFYLSFII